MDEAAKQGLRKRMKEERAARKDAAALARLAQERLLRNPLWQEAGTIALYVAKEPELDTGMLLESAWKEGRRILLPRMTGGGPAMKFVPCQGYDQLVPGPFGLLEPAGESGIGPEGFAPDICVLPGLAFSPRGARMGYGRGCYDRFLGAVPERAFPCIGFCFSFQIEPELTPEPWDIAMDHVCTDDAMYDCGSYSL